MSSKQRSGRGKRKTDEGSSEEDAGQKKGGKRGKKQDEPFAVLMAAINEGKMPSGDQVNACLEYSQNALQEWAPASGKAPLNTLVQQVNGMLEGMKKLGGAKMDKATSELVKRGSSWVASAQKRLTEVKDVVAEVKEIKEDATALYAAAKEFLWQMITSGDMRSLTTDFLGLVQDIAGAKMEAITREDSSSASVEGETAKGKKRAKGAAKKAKKIAKEAAALTDEQRKQIQDKFSTLVTKISSSDALKKGASAFFRLASHLQTVASSAKDKAEEMKDQVASLKEIMPGFSEIWTQTRDIVEKTTGIKMESLFSDSYDFIAQSLSEPRFFKYFGDLRDLLTEGFSTPKILQDAKYLTRWNNLVDEGRKMFSELTPDFNDTFAKFVNQAKSSFDTLAKAPAQTLLSALQTGASAVTDKASELTDKAKDAAGAAGQGAASAVAAAGHGAANVVAQSKEALAQLFDTASGKLTLRPESLAKMRDITVRLILDQLKHMPVPKIEGSNDTYDYCFEDVTFNVNTLLPDMIHVRFENEASFDVAKATTEFASATLVISATNIKPVVNNIKFSFRRKGLLEISDQGIAAASLTGDGASINIEVELNTEDFQRTGRLFKVNDVTCTIDALKIAVMEAKHETLLNIVTPLISGSLKTMLEEQVTEALRKRLDFLERDLHRIVDQSSSLGSMMSEKLAQAPEAARTLLAAAASSLPHALGAAK